MPIKHALRYRDVATGMLYRPCKEDFAEAVEKLGGAKVWKTTAYTPSAMIARGVKLSSVLWAFTQMLAKHNPSYAARFAVLCAEAALPAYESANPQDNLPRRTIEAAKTCIAEPNDANRQDAQYGALFVDMAAVAWAALSASASNASVVADSAEEAVGWSASGGVDVITILETFMSDIDE